MLFYLTAGLVGLAALLVPFIGSSILRFLFKKGDVLSQKQVPRYLPAIIFLGIGIPVLGIICLWTKTPGDWILLILLACSFALGIVPSSTVSIDRRYRLLVQTAIAVLPVMAGSVLEVIPSSYVLNALLTIVFVVSALNFLEVINFINGLSSLGIFIAAACIAAILSVVTTRLMVGDPAGVVFALALCGGSLGFVLYRRPPSQTKDCDPASLLLGGALCLLLIRTWNLIGHASVPAGVFLPFILVVPILLAGIHHEQMSLYRRQRLAVLLITVGQVPAWVPLLMGQGHVSAGVALSIGSMILWTALITQGRALRGWSMRVTAEPIADVLRIGFLVSVLSLIFCLPFGVMAWWVLASTITTTAFLVLQLTWWRRRLERVNHSDVIIFANREDYHKTQQILNNCADLFGRQRTRRARIGLHSKHLRDTVREHLIHGDTVVILGDEVRHEVQGLRILGDLIFARDCLLICHSNHEIDPESIPGVVVDTLQQTSHRILAAIGLLMTAPAFALIAILIKLDDNGPVFFRQERLGLDGRRFSVLKFRSMKVDTPVYGESPVEGHDRRVTRTGRLLRRTSLDELPQLINVIRGEMRLVGPRPEMPFICAQYGARERKRLEVPPGVTGLWQVSAHRNDPIHDHVEYDLAYRHARGPFLDIAILISTVIGTAHTGY